LTIKVDQLQRTDMWNYVFITGCITDTIEQDNKIYVKSNRHYYSQSGVMITAKVLE